MTIVATPQPIASAFHVPFGNSGDGSRSAQPRGVCPPGVYREATGVTDTLESQRRHQEMARRRARRGELELPNAAWQKRRAQAVVRPEDQPAALTGASAQSRAAWRRAAKARDAW